MGTIALRARKAFLERDRYDYREYKKLTNAEIEQRMLKLPVKPPIFYKLSRLQRICFIIGAETGRFIYLNDTGTGKTLLSIALIRYFRKLGTIRRALILVPNRPNKGEWRDELFKHSPKSTCLVLPSEIKAKWEQLESTDTLFVVETYAGLFRMVTKKEAKKKGKGNKLVLDQTKIRHLQKAFGGFVCDESVNVGNHQGLPFRVCRQLSKTSKVVFELTATPFNRDPVLLWSQFFLVDGGYTLGETLGLFRATFCNESENYFSGAPEYKFAKKKKTLLNEYIANRSISFPADEGDMPKCVPVIKHVDLGEDAQQYYEKFKEQLIASRGNFQETKNAFVRMRQISSGFVGYEDDETGERAKFEFPDNPKLDLLFSLLNTVREHKSIVFFEFNYSGEKIYNELKKLKIGVELIYGKQKHVDVAKTNFIKNDKTRVLLLQNAMAAGLNVQVAKYGFFYESPASAIMRKQAQRRVERQHSLYKTVFIYDLLMRGGVDEQILKFHEEGGDLFEAIVRAELK